ncbi:hypothetical protein ACFL2V_16330 [Pseudomonadota bacterium]
MTVDPMDEILDLIHEAPSTPQEVIAHEILRHHPDSYKTVTNLDQIEVDSIHSLQGEDLKKLQMLSGLNKSLEYLAKEFQHKTEIPLESINTHTILLQNIAKAVGILEERDGFLILTEYGQTEVHAYRQIQHGGGLI